MSLSDEDQADRPAATRAHGGAATEELAHLGIDPEQMIDFSSSINPYGPSPVVLDAVRSARIDRYPDPTAASLRLALASANDTSPDRIVAGNGAADLLWTLARVLIRPDTPVLIVEPTFAEFRAAASFAGARILEWRATRSDHFALDLGAIEERLSHHSATVLYLCSPSTPAGARAPVESIAAIAARHPGCTVVLDQAFVSLSDHPEDLAVPVPSNVVRVRSLTKEHAMAGLRLGYLLSTRELAARAEAARPPWTTSSVAQAAGLAALGESNFVETSRRRMLADRKDLAAGLRSIGCEPVASSTAFLLLPVGDAPALRRRLLSAKVLVRDCSSFGLPDFIRLAARPRTDREQLIQALRRELARC